MTHCNSVRSLCLPRSTAQKLTRRLSLSTNAAPAHVVLLCTGSVNELAEVWLSLILKIEEIELLGVLVHNETATTGPSVIHIVLDSKLDFMPPPSVSISLDHGSRRVEVNDAGRQVLDPQLSARIELPPPSSDLLSRAAPLGAPGLATPRMPAMQAPVPFDLPQRPAATHPACCCWQPPPCYP